MRSAAVFDLDGTLLRGTSSERLLLPYLLRRRLIGGPQLLAALRRLATLPLAGATDALRRNKQWLAGVEARPVLSCIGAFLRDVLVPRLRPSALARLQELRRSGASSWLLTGAPDFVAQPLAEILGMDGAVATSLEVRGGRFTGELAGRHVFAEAKRDLVLELAAAQSLDLASSSGFADHGSDIPFLECFGRAVAVAPDRRLRKAASGRGWEVLSGS